MAVSAEASAGACRQPAHGPRSLLGEDDLTLIGHQIRDAVDKAGAYAGEGNRPAVHQTQHDVMTGALVDDARHDILVFAGDVVVVSIASKVEVEDVVEEVEIGDDVVARAVTDRTCRRKEEAVAPGSAGQDVVAFHAVKDVVPFPAIQNVRAEVPGHEVVEIVAGSAP